MFVSLLIKQPQLILDSARNQPTSVASSSVKIQVDPLFEEKDDNVDNGGTLTTISFDSSDGVGRDQNNSKSRMDKNLYTFSASAGQQLKKDMHGITKPWVLLILSLVLLKHFLVLLRCYNINILKFGHIVAKLSKKKWWTDFFIRFFHPMSARSCFTVFDFSFSIHAFACNL